MQATPNDISAQDPGVQEVGSTRVKLTGVFNPFWHAGIMFALPVLSEWLWWWLGGPPWVALLSVVEYMLGAVYILAFMACTPSLLLKVTRAHAAAVLLCCLAALPCFAIGSILQLDVSAYGMSRFTNQSQFVIDAIQKHVQEKGVQPMALADLVPTYLAEVPTTGIATSPNFEYTKSPSGRGIWSLSVPIDRTTTWGHLVYRSDNIYIQVADGYSFRKIGKWAYKASTQ